MPSFEALMKAKTLLGLHENASLSEIKFRYKNLIRQWHPDKHIEDVALATKMSAQINEAYETVQNYCSEYQYPFDEESIKRATQSPHEWWKDRFGPN
ncbi:MAG: J domain-containing protein [Campylobacterota bacterium]|nr:J domain-containing protein [Campylobacterota bacterium]